MSIPVGVIHLEIPAQSQALASLPFEPFDEALGAIMGMQLVAGDRILKWRSDQQAYQIAYRTGGEAGDAAGAWSDAPDGAASSVMTIQMGEGFWIANAQKTSQTVYFTGEIALEPAIGIPIAPAFSLIGFPYSTGIAAAETTAGDAHDTILVMGADGHYRPPRRFDMGQGYWARHHRGDWAAWTESRPYAAPFPTNGLPPRVVQMDVTPDGHSVRLHITSEGVSGEVLDVCYQDITPETEFNPLKGWRLASLGNTTAGRQEIDWIDSGAADRPAVKDVFGRLYLVARGDIDSDSDGLPDARERFVLGTAAGNSDTDGDGALDGAEVEQGSNPLMADAAGGDIIYVCSKTGNDLFDGRLKAAVARHGPKKTVRGAILEALRRKQTHPAMQPCIQVSGGVYHEDVNVPAGVLMTTDGLVIVE